MSKQTKSTTYFSIKGTEKTFVKFSVYYDKGSLNYNTGSVNARGFYVQVILLDKTEINGKIFESFDLYNSGFNKFLFEVSKDGKKNTLDAFKLVDNIKSELIEKLLSHPNYRNKNYTVNF